MELSTPIPVKSDAPMQEAQENQQLSKSAKTLKSDKLGVFAKILEGLVQNGKHGETSEDKQNPVLSLGKSKGNKLAQTENLSLRKNNEKGNLMLSQAHKETAKDQTEKDGDVQEGLNLLIPQENAKDTAVTKMADGKTQINRDENLSRKSSFAVLSFTSYSTPLKWQMDAHTFRLSFHCYYRNYLNRSQMPRSNY
jgi:hypothetical protein